MNYFQSLKPMALHMAFWLSLAFSLLSLTTACSQPSSRDKIRSAWDNSNPKIGAQEMDGFWMDNRSPADKPAPRWEFYYKHCAFEGRSYMNQQEYLCTAPY
jgi:hypothetical protein